MPVADCGDYEEIPLTSGEHREVGSLESPSSERTKQATFAALLLFSFAKRTINMSESELNKL